jgi:hypothetical protein
MPGGRARTLFVGATLYDGASCVSSPGPVALYCSISSAMRATETYRPHIAFRPSRRHPLDTSRAKPPWTPGATRAAPPKRRIRRAVRSATRGGAGRSGRFHQARAEPAEAGCQGRYLTPRATTCRSIAEANAVAHPTVRHGDPPAPRKPLGPLARIRRTRSRVACCVSICSQVYQMAGRRALFIGSDAS